METDNPIRILFVEDVPSDAEIAARELQKGGIQFTSARVDTKETFLKALEEFQPDIIISDYSMPEFDGMKALELAKEYGAAIPWRSAESPTGNERRGSLPLSGPPPSSGGRPVSGCSIHVKAGR